MELSKPLREWIVSGDELHREYPVYETATEEIVIRNGEKYEIFQRVNYQYVKVATTEILPSTAIPTDNNQEYKTMIAPVVAPTSFTTSLDTLQEWEKQMLSNLEIMQDLPSVINHMTNSVIHIATDGSSKSTKGTFSWIVSTETGIRLAKNRGTAYGYRPTSLRAEAYGVLSSLRFMFRMIEYHAIQMKTPITIHTDSTSLIKKSKNIEATHIITPA